MNIAIFDYQVARGNPVGSCHLRLINGLRGRHQFVLFSVGTELPETDDLRVVKVRAPKRPLALLFVAYHLLAPVSFLTYKMRGGHRPDVVQFVESNLAFGDVAYAHFCHRRYLKQEWRRVRTPGLRSAVRWLDHKLHAALEPHAFRRARWIVVPSRALAAELAEEYPATQSKTRVISNAVETDSFRTPPGTDREDLRRKIGLAADDAVLVFVALGQFDRKGLPLVIEALGNISDDARPQLVVVGGQPDAIRPYKRQAAAIGVGDSVHFVGMQRDTRQFLWAADAFILPSAYEVFPLVALEAAAAALPLIVTRVSGVEEFVRDGVNGLIVDDRSVEGVTRSLQRFLSEGSERWQAWGVAAQDAVADYSPEQFIKKWEHFYSEVERS